MLSQIDRVALWLGDGNSITSLEAFKKFGVTRLSAIIYRLRHDIDRFGIVCDEWITVKTRYGKAHVKRYFL